MGLEDNSQVTLMADKWRLKEKGQQGEQYATGE
jgi:hypothetical protein